VPEALKIRKLKVSYSNANAIEKPVLRNLDLDILPGEAVGIYGVSGSGKTTLARAMMRMLPATAQIQGSIELGDRNLLAVSMPEMQRIRGSQIGLIPQEPSLALNPFVKAGKQVEELLRAHRRSDGQAQREEARRLLELFFATEAERIASRYPHQLSGGERQRVVICQAIACGPSLLVADEPASAVDSIALKTFLDILGQLRQSRRISMILISHNLAALRYVADRCLELREGRLQ
jgi:ABC-type glutathione transport system ATPase component